MLSEAVIISAFQTILISMLIYYFQRKQKKHDDEVRQRAEARKNESLLLLELNMACAGLAYAVAIAIKNNKVNGEVTEGITAYEKAKGKYFAFLNEQAKDHLQE